MLALLPTTLLFLTSLAVQVQSELCPSAPAIEAALASMLPPSQSAAQPSRVRVFWQGKRLQVELWGPDGLLIGQRSLDEPSQCAELASRVAVVVASWMSDVHPEFSRPAPEPPSKGSAGKSSAPLPPPPVPASFDVAAGASLSYAGSAALGGSLAATWIPHATGLGLRISAETETKRTLALAQDRLAAWRRWTATTDADWRSCLGSVALDADAGVAWTVLTADGSGFPQNASLTSLAPGIAAGARLSWWATRHTSAWLSLDGAFWLRRQLLSATPDGPERQIPRFGLAATLGVALGREPRTR